MQDRFGREINYLRIAVTDRCNFRCLFCLPTNNSFLPWRKSFSETAGYVPLPKEEILSYEEILEVVKAALKLGINRFRLTGGEPLIRKGIIEFIQRLKALSGVKRISLTTNGYFLKVYAKELVELNLDSINVGLSTLKEDRFRKLTGIVFDEKDPANHRLNNSKGVKTVWEGIKLLLEAGMNLKLNTVVLKGVNTDEVIDFAKLSLYYPLKVRFIEYMPCGDWIKNRNLVIPGLVIKARIRQELGELIPAQDEFGDGPAQYFRVKDSLGLIGFILPVSRPFCKMCNRLRLTPDGNLKSCLLSEETINLKPYLREGVKQEELTQAIKQAILAKPLQHQAYRKFAMCQIGG